jgi:ubiquinone/menaquinone biosynthesis C-methylase UbiE
MKPVQMFLDRLWEKRANRFAALHLPYLTPGEQVLDVGAGNCRVGRIINSRGMPTTAIDVADYNATDLPLTVYDGIHIPFADGSFDVVIVNSVLHHCADPDAVLREAVRVSRARLQIVEDPYSNRLDLALLKFNDFLTNRPFGNATPFLFRTIPQWRRTFASLRLTVEAERAQRSMLKLANLHLFVLNKRPMGEEKLDIL